MKSDEIPLLVPDLRGNEIAYLTQCVTDNWVSSAGPFIIEFERRIAELSNARHAIATVNGTCALELILRAMQLKSDDLVVVPDWTFAATANAVIHSGATPVFCDISDSDWCLDPKKLVDLLAQSSGAIRAVIAVHSMGAPAKMDALATLCRKYDAALLEDAAGALGARFGNRPVGAIARAGFFSFNGNKLITAGGGGMIVTNDDTLADSARAISTQSRVGGRYQHDQAGLNYRMTNVNAAIGLAQIERLEEMLAIKRRIFSRYDAAFREQTGLNLPPRPAGRTANNWMYCTITSSPKEAESLEASLNSRGIGARLFWESLSSQAPYAAYASTDVAVSRAISGRVVSLPASTTLTEMEQDRVIDAALNWLQGDKR